MNSSPSIDYILIEKYGNLYRKELLNRQGICWGCKMKHYPFCDIQYVGCRNCKCGKEWHPLNGPCRVGPETEFAIYNCYCEGYIPLNNLEYLEWKYNKNNEQS